MNKRIVTNILPSVELTVAGPYDPTTKLGNYDQSRSNIDRVIIHTMVGSAQAAANRFADLNSNVSAHYGVRLDGTLIHWLEETYTAYHAGDYLMNQRSIGIEHEDGGDYNGVRPDILYATSAKLVADICQFYNIPIDRKHILKHSEVSDAPTGCPDALDIDRIVRQAILVPPPAPQPAPTPPPAPDYKQFAQLTLQILNGHAFAWDKVNGLKKLAARMGIK
ncbi:MAG TPA: peptidoglycan recognition family protein [Methylomirabilota bacterium]|nr:peptidoglycan recognition family protein [Methylomirabilota bacterium]